MGTTAHADHSISPTPASPSTHDTHTHPPHKKVEVLEESEGWALVKDPPVRRAWCRCPTCGLSAGGANGGAARPDGSFGDAGGVTRRSRSLSRTVSGSPGRPDPWGGAGRPARQPSLQSKEDLLGDMFDRAGDQHAAGGTFGGDARAHPSAPRRAAATRDAAPSPRGHALLPPEAAPRRAGARRLARAGQRGRRFGSGDWGGLLGGGGSARHGGADAGPGPARMLSGVGGLHHRTVSGGSSERGGASTSVSPGGRRGRPGTASEGTAPSSPVRVWELEGGRGAAGSHLSQVLEGARGSDAVQALGEERFRCARDWDARPGTADFASRPSRTPVPMPPTLQACGGDGGGAGPWRRETGCWCTTTPTAGRA